MVEFCTGRSGYVHARIVQLVYSVVIQLADRLLLLALYGITRNWPFSANRIGSSWEAMEAAQSIRCGVLSRAIYTSPTKIVQAIAIANAIIGKLTRANSLCKTRMSFLYRLSRQSRPASDAPKEMLKAP